MDPALPFLVLMLQLVMSSPDSFRDPVVWNSAEWQAITRIPHAPWSSNATLDSTRLSADELAAVKAFVERYATITDGEGRARFAVESKFTGRTDEENYGRLMLAWWSIGLWRRINLVVRERLESHRFDVRKLEMQGVSNNIVCIECIPVCA